jgi:uncharacterized iron-regulated membrane protein
VKLAARSFKIQLDLHAWLGVVSSVLLFVIFYCGVFALFHDELGVWQDPRLPHHGPAVSTPPAFDVLLRQLEQRVQIPQGAGVYLERHARFASAWVGHAPTNLELNLTLDYAGATRQPSDAQHSRLAEELYFMHFLYRAPGGIELAGCMGVALLVALVSGLVIHVKDLLRQAWQFRPRLRLRFSASDAHKVLGVFGLPFGLMFGWSGAVLGLFVLVSAPFVGLVYGGDERAFETARGYPQPKPPDNTRNRPMLPLDDLIAKATHIGHAHWPKAAPLAIEHVALRSYGAPDAWLTVGFATKAFEQHRQVHLAAHSGELLGFYGDGSAPAAQLDRVLFDLHYALFGGMLVKALYALLALGMCAVLLTGNLVWLERRDARRKHAGNRWLERGSVGACFGLVFGSAAYFAANRWLPSGMERRADVEFGLFLGAWALSLVAVLSWSAVSARRWTARLNLGAALLFGSVLARDCALEASAWWSTHARVSGDWLSVELLVLGLCVSCAAVSRLTAAPG